MNIKKKIGTSLISIGYTASMVNFSLATLNPNQQTLPGEVTNVVNNILGALQAVGVIVAVGLLIYAGFKYMTAGAGDKAKTKDMLVPFAVGALLIATAPFIANWIFNSIAKTSTGQGNG